STRPSSAATDGSVSPGSTRPFPSRSSAPSGTPPPSLSATSGLVVVEGSASARKQPFVTSVPGPGTDTPASSPSGSPSSSESQSSASMMPSPSLSFSPSTPSGRPSSSLSGSSGSVPAAISCSVERPSPSGSSMTANVTDAASDSPAQADVRQISSGYDPGAG